MEESISHTFRDNETGSRIKLWIFETGKYEKTFHSHKGDYFRGVKEEVTAEEFHKLVNQLMNSDVWEAQ